MAYQVTMPQMGYDMTEGAINRWLVEEGSQVERGDVIASIATEKADIDIEAYASGILRKILAQPGARIPVGGAIAIIADADEDISSVGTDTAPAPEGRPVVEAAAQDSAPVELQTSGTAAREAAGSEGVPLPDWAHRLNPDLAMPEDRPAVRRVKASPLARRRARELGIEIARVKGNGPDGRITGEDVEAVARSGGVAVVASTPAGPSPARLSRPSPQPQRRRRAAKRPHRPEETQILGRAHLKR